MITGFVCKSSVERVERVVRGLVDAGLAETEISIVYPRRARAGVCRGEFSGSLSRQEGFTPEIESLMRQGLALVRLERASASHSELDASKQLARSGVEGEEHRDDDRDAREEVLLVVRCNDDGSLLRGSNVFAAAGGVWEEDVEGSSSLDPTRSGHRRNDDA